MIKIEQLLPLLKKGWVAMDEGGEWWWFDTKPKRCRCFWWITTDYRNQFLSPAFDIEPVEDWTKSLMRCGDE